MKLNKNILFEKNPFKMIVTKKYFLLLLSIVIISCGGEDDPVEVNIPQETFGTWSPDFTNQTSDFNQTRTGSQGTKQTRSINVTSSSRTTSSTEESINQDINADGDLFEDIDVILTTYTGSENLGNHQITTYNVSVDNDMGLKIGNNFYSLDDGYIDFDGDEEFCNERNIFYYLWIELLGENINYNDDDGVYTGSGKTIGIEVIIDDYNINNNEVYEIPFVLDKVNEFYSQNITNWSEYDSFLDNYFPDSDDDGYYDLEETINNTDPNDSNSYGGVVNYLFCDSNGDYGLESSYNKSVSDIDVYTITNGNVQNNTSQDEVYMFQNTLQLSKTSDNLYTIKMNGTTLSQLPVKLYYKGYLSLYDF
tara:strand:+ start:645 stop:1736 length:1092 start_codon:yes stop_codon:yes gene_type:complete